MRSPFRPSRQSIQGAGGYWGSLVQPVLGRDAHRPQDQAGMRSAVRELAASGLQPRDIAAALSLTEGAVRQLLEVSR